MRRSGAWEWTMVRNPLLAAAVVAITLGVCAFVAPGAFALLATMAAGGVALWFVWRLCRPTTLEDRPFFLYWTLGSVALHTGIGLVVAAIPSAVRYLGPDANQYDRLAHQLAQHWVHGAPTPQISSGKEAFAYALGGLYVVLGRHVAAGIALNALCAGALVLVVSDTARRIGDERAVRVTAALVTLLPGFVLWPSLLLREASVFLLIAVAINGAFRLVERITIARAFVVAASISLLFSNRASVAAVLAISLVIGDLLARRRLIASVAAVLATGAFTALIMFSLGTGSAGLRYIVDLNFGDVSSLRSGLSETAKSGTGGLNSFGDYVSAGADFAIGPLPWQVERPSQIPGAIDGIVMILLIPSFVRGVRVGIRRVGSRVLVLLIPSALLFGVLAVIGGNFGFIVRERPQVLVIMVPLIALGITAHPRMSRMANATT